MANSGGFKKGKKKVVNMSPAGHHSRQKKMKIRMKRKPAGGSIANGMKTPVTMVDKTRAKAMKMLSKGGY